ncbi:MAG TPA: transketolase [Gammaproteobacteria bacterium]|nr:transketolase [Gammaproteobacteria bacterium]
MPTRLELANALRMLSVDAVQKANSGHPGMPMGMADIAEVLWNDFLRHNPADPNWINRDRFMLSNGHGAMLHYALLHLTGYNLSIEDLKHFRQLHSKTPGHPEYGYTPGVETTTGPLGQGFANAVGMAIAEKALAAEFNRGGINIIDHFTYVFVGDGCLMEGISHEAASLAGTQMLGKLIAFYDDNSISIDGDVRGWFTDNTVKRFEAYNWHVVPHVDGHDPKTIYSAIEEARSVTDRPSLICCKTQIGFGSPNLAGTAKTHGSPLGEAEVAEVRKQLEWPYPPFVIPPEIYTNWNAKKLGTELEEEWRSKFHDYRKANSILAQEFQRRTESHLPKEWESKTQVFIRNCAEKPQNIATRKASELCLNAIAPLLPELMGGSADLTGSNNTWHSLSRVFNHYDPTGNYIHYGVREFAMFAMMNGIALHRGFIPYGGTFLTFIDYGRNAIRLAAMMKQRVIYVLTHDSIGLGEDGPTHQPVEHAAILRLTPNLAVWRPCDLVETAVAWKAAIERMEGPSALLLSRQNLPQQERDKKTMLQIHRGGYVLLDCSGRPEAIIIATGSEVCLAMAAGQSLIDKGHKVRVVSMPSTTVFDQQEPSYQDSVLPRKIKARVAVEAGISDFWYKYVGREGKIVGLTRYGESAPYQEVYDSLGITVEHIEKAVKSLI